jgi:hypothetical protein
LKAIQIILSIAILCLLSALGLVVWNNHKKTQTGNEKKAQIARDGKALKKLTEKSEENETENTESPDKAKD